MLRSLYVRASSALSRVPQRYWLCLAVALCVTVFNIMNLVELWVFDKIVMVRDAPTLPYVPGSYSCPYHAQKYRPQQYQYAQFLWGPKVKRAVFVVCYWAPVLTELPSGVWADLYGGHRILFWSLLTSSVLTLLTPSAVVAGDFFYFGILLLRRFAAGVMLPASISLLGHWAQPQERTVFIAVLCSGWAFGLSLGSTISISLLYWSHQFYVSGALALATAVLWWYTARAWQDDRLRSPHSHHRVKSVPLLRLVSAPLVLAAYPLALGSHGVSPITQGVISYYLKTALFCPLSDTLERMGLWLVALSLLADIAPSLGVGLASDYLVWAGLLGRPAARRVMMAAGCLGAALGALLVIPARCDSTLVIGCYAVVDYFNSWQRTLLLTVPLDAAPRLAGTLTALLHVTGSIAVRVSGRAVIRFTGAWGPGDVGVWAVVFAVAALLIVVLPLPYLAWGPFSALPWAKHPSLIVTPDTFRSRMKCFFVTTIVLLIICVLIVVTTDM